MEKGQPFLVARRDCRMPTRTEECYATAMSTSVTALAPMLHDEELAALDRQGRGEA